VGVGWGRLLHGRGGGGHCALKSELLLCVRGSAPNIQKVEDRTHPTLRSSERKKLHGGRFELPTSRLQVECSTAKLSTALEQAYHLFLPNEFQEFDLFSLAMPLKHPCACPTSTLSMHCLQLYTIPHPDGTHSPSLPRVICSVAVDPPPSPQTHTTHPPTDPHPVQ
jgi:hypothetical protein